MSKSSQVVFLEGKRVDLRPVEAADMPVFARWMNDPETRGLTGETKPTGPADVSEWMDRVMKESESRVWFAVVERESGRVIGETGLLRMFYPWRTTDLTIIIFDREARGKGYGTEVMEIMLDYAFGYLNFHRISIGVVGFNEKALRFYERIGFKTEGIQRDGYYYNHRYYDFVMMSILEDEYRAMYHKG